MYFIYYDYKLHCREINITSTSAPVITIEGIPEVTEIKSYDLGKGMSTPKFHYIVDHFRVPAIKKLYEYMIKLKGNQLAYIKGELKLLELEAEEWRDTK